LPRRLLGVTADNEDPVNPKLVELAEDVAKVGLISDHSRGDVGYQGETTVAKATCQIEGRGYPLVV
jgi:hypothetical protein